MSTSEVHGALARAAEAGPYAPKRKRPHRAALQEFFAHGVRYAFAPKRYGMTRGMPTAHSAPKAARNDPALYHLPALVDALRLGSERERRVPAPLLARELGL